MIRRTASGLYCVPGDFYIDPHRKVKLALVTHAHADHAYRGHEQYYCCDRNAPILRARIAKGLNIRSFPYCETFELNGVTISFHPAGHIVGSAQIRLERNGEIWVITGDYKVEDDGLTEPYTPIPCHHFISECTFGLPIYNWVPQALITEEMKSWIATVKQAGGIALFNAYSLGKAQRIMHILSDCEEIWVDSTVARMNEAVEEAGYQLPGWRLLSNSTNPREIRKGAVVVGGGNCESLLAEHFGMEVYNSTSSGWMALPKRYSNSMSDAQFILSDHADWPGLNWSIAESKAENVYLMHGDPRALMAIWSEKGKRMFDWNKQTH
jgi:putative mRNA 3-end processing factor